VAAATEHPEAENSDVRHGVAFEGGQQRVHRLPPLGVRRHPQRDRRPAAQHQAEVVPSAPAAGRRVGVVAVVADHKVEADVTQRGERDGPLPRSLLEQRQPPHPTAAAAAAAAADG